MPLANHRQLAFDRAKNLAAQGQLNEAIDRVQRLLSQSANRAMALQCAIWLAKVERHEETVLLMLEIPIEELDNQHLCLLANAYEKTGLLNEAADTYARVTPPDIKVLKKQAHALLMIGRDAEAIKVLRAGYKIDRNIVGAIRHWAIVCAQEGDEANAARIHGVAQLIEENAKAPAGKARLPSRTQQMSEYANWLLANGQTDTALQKLRFLVSRHPHDVELAVEYINALRGAKHFGAALGVATRSRNLNIGSAELTLLNGQLLLEAGNAWKAIPILRRAQTLAPHDPEIVVLLGSALDQIGASDEAITLLFNAHNSYPAHSGIITMLGGILSRSGRSNEALTAMDSLYPHRFNDGHIASIFGAAYLDAGDTLALDALLAELPQTILDHSSMRHIRAYYRFLQCESEVARRILEPVMPEQTEITPSVILYIACADETDLLRQQIASRFGKGAYYRAQDAARELQSTVTVPDAYKPRLGARTSPVMTSPLYTMPISGAASRELKPWLIDKYGLQ